jgi:8-oxo-dGTP diphosphatase
MLPRAAEARDSALVSVFRASPPLEAMHESQWARTPSTYRPHATGARIGAKAGGILTAMAARSSGVGGTDSRKWPVKTAESYGGVVVRDHDGTREVALIRVRNLKGKDVWALPKGGRELDESGEEAAVREVREETGLNVDVVESLDSVTYWFLWPPEQARYKKTVHLYLMRVRDGDTNDHDDEVEEVRFVPIDQAARIATYRTDKDVLKRAARAAAAW